MEQQLLQDVTNGLDRSANMHQMQQQPAAAKDTAAAQTADTTMQPSGTQLVQQAAPADADGQSSEQDEQDGDPGAWKQLLWQALSAAAPPSRFAVSGRLDTLQPLPWQCPEVTVEGVGRLGLPLSREQAVTLKAVAEQAPHGKGLRTVVDTAVRDAFQVDASKVHIGSSWEPVLAAAVSKVAAGLSLSERSSSHVQARPYKLLLYEQGGHFTAHQDTEKEPGQVGTLVVQLPCGEGHTGGVLTVRHKGQTFAHDFSQASASSLQYAAFFADCEHELSPITSGLRLVLVYNLCWTGPPGELPRLQDRSPAEVQLQRALKAWEAELQAGGTQHRIALLLEHHYTKANLSFSHLKGTDRAMVRALSTCPGLDAHLVLVTRTVSGSTESDYCYKKRRRWCEDESEEEDYMGRPPQHTMLEAYDDRTSTSDWIARDGSTFKYGAINAATEFWDPEGGELFGPDDEPDEENYEGYTGNAGPTLDHVYHRTLLVLWPASTAVKHARALGLPALMSLLQMRLAAAATLIHCLPSSSSSGGAPSSHLQGQAASAGQAGTGEAAGAGDAAAGQAESGTTAAGEAAAGEAAAAPRGGPSRSDKQKWEQVAALTTALLDACVSQLIEPFPQQQQQQQQQQGQWARMGTSCLPGTLPRNYIAAQHAKTCSPVQTVALLKQGCRAIKQGIRAAAAPLLRLVTYVTNLQGCLGAEDLLRALAQAARALDTAAVLPPLQQLVSRSMVYNPVGTVKFVLELDRRPDLQQPLAEAALAAAAADLAAVRPLLVLAAGLSAFPALQQQVVDRLESAVKANAAADVAQLVAQNLLLLQAHPPLMQQLATAAAGVLCAAGPLQQVASLTALLQACQGQAQLQQQVVGAVCTALQTTLTIWQYSGIGALMLSLSSAAPQLIETLQAAAASALFSAPALLAGQSAESMLSLAATLLTVPPLKAAHLPAFAAAAAQRPDSPMLLQLLLQFSPLASDAEAVQQLVQAAAAALRGSQGLRVWQVSDMMPLVAALNSQPALQLTLAAAVVETVLSNSVLLSRQTDASMLQLLDLLFLQDGQLCGAHFPQFAAAAARRQNPDGLLKQLLQAPAVVACAAAQEQLVIEIAAAIRRRSGVWQVTEAVKVAGVVQQGSLQQKLLIAIAEAVFTSTQVLQGQTANSMLQLSDLLLANRNLRAAYYEDFAAAVSRRDESYKLRQQLLQSRAVKAALQLPGVQALVASQVRALESLSAVPPFSWSMPEARLPSFPAVEAFLKGPNQSYTLRGCFSGIADARRTVTALVGRPSYSFYGGQPPVAATDAYSITATAAGSGKNAHVVINKTRVWYDSIVRRKAVYVQELQAVKALLVAPPGA